MRKAEVGTQKAEVRTCETRPQGKTKKLKRRSEISNSKSKSAKADPSRKAAPFGGPPQGERDDSGRLSRKADSSSLAAPRNDSGRRVNPGAKSNSRFKISDSKNGRIDWGRVWAEVQDRLVPALQLKPSELAVYLHLLRHTRLVGRRRIRMSAQMLGRGVCLSHTSARLKLHILIRKRCIRVAHWGTQGHVVEVLLPEEIAADLAPTVASAAREHRLTPMRSRRKHRRVLRESNGACFYCSKRLARGRGQFDHVVPLAWGGSEDDWNVVLSCMECNVRKGQSDAGDFLRTLWRQGRIARLELRARLAKVTAIQKQAA